MSARFCLSVSDAKTSPRATSRDGKFIVFNSKRSANIHFEAIVMAGANGDNERVLLEHGLQMVTESYI